jgi:hypothetical protein
MICTCKVIKVDILLTKKMVDNKVLLKEPIILFKFLFLPLLDMLLVMQGLLE